MESSRTSASTNGATPAEDGPTPSSEQVRRRHEASEGDESAHDALVSQRHAPVAASHDTSSAFAQDGSVYAASTQAWRREGGREELRRRLTNCDWRRR